MKSSIPKLKPPGKAFFGCSPPSLIALVIVAVAVWVAVAHHG